MKLEGDLEVITDVTTGSRQLYARGNGVFHDIGTVAPTKWGAISKMFSALAKACEDSDDWSSAKSACQSIIDAATPAHPADVSSQVFDPHKLMRPNSRLGEVLKRAAAGDYDAMGQFPSAFMQEEMIRKFGSHVVRFTTPFGDGLGSGILIRLRNGAPAILTCAHVWKQLACHSDVQMLCAAVTTGVYLDQKMIKVPVAKLSTLDMGNPEFMELAGVDAMTFKRDAAIITGAINRLFPIGARAVDLHGVGQLAPEAETYALVGYPLAARGELGARFLEHASPARNTHVFTKHPKDPSRGSLNGASGGLIVAIRNSRYRPVAMLIEEQGAVVEAAADSYNQATEPSAFHALPLFSLRTMMETTGATFWDRDGRVDHEDQCGSICTAYGTFKAT